MKKTAALFLAAGLMITALCGCAKQEEKEYSEGVQISADESGITFFVSEASEIDQTARIDIKDGGKVSAPENSVSFEEACKLLDSCSMEALYLPQKASDFEKMYFATVDYEGGKYYSVYNCVSVNGKKIPVGTNCLISYSGDKVLKKDWMGGYSVVDTNTADQDQTFDKMYPDATIKPTEAIAVLAANEDKLGLDDSITKKVFEFDKKLFEVEGIPCYKITPKTEYTKSIELKTAYYVSAQKGGEIYYPKGGKGYKKLA